MPLEYAAPWRRGAAFLLDLVIAAPLGWLGSMALWLGAGAMGAIFCQASEWQSTPGKALLRVKLIEANGRRVGLGRAVMRVLLQYGSVVLVAGLFARPYRLPAVLSYTDTTPTFASDWTPRSAWFVVPLVVAVFLLLVDRRHRTWWDRVCGTSVISLPRSEVKADEQRPDRA